MKHIPRRSMGPRRLGCAMTAPALDAQTAAEVVATLVLRQLDKAEIVLHGDAYEVTRCQVLRLTDDYPWAVSLTISDDTRGESINVTMSLAVDPIPRWDR